MLNWYTEQTLQSYKDRLCEAEKLALIHEALAARPQGLAFHSVVRQNVGLWLVAIGEWVQGPKCAPTTNAC